VKSFICRPVWLSGNRKWVVQAAEDGGNYAAVAPVQFYDIQAECAAERDRRDDAEDGKP
jgi:hypothetical protein